MNEPHHYLSQMPIIMPAWIWPVSFTVTLWSLMVMVPTEWCQVQRESSAWAVRVTIAVAITILTWVLFFINMDLQ